MSDEWQDLPGDVIISPTLIPEDIGWQDMLEEPIVTDRLDTIIESSPQPQIIRSILEQSRAINQSLGVPIEQAVEQASALVNSPDPQPKKLGQAIVDRWNAEQITVQLGQIGYEALRHPERTDELMKQYDNLTNQLPALEDVMPAYPGIFGKLAEFGRKAVTGAAGLISLQAEIIAGERQRQRYYEATAKPLLEQIKAFALQGLQPFTGIGEIEAGHAYIDMLKAGVDPAIARPFASGIGAINNILEFAQFATFVKMFPGADIAFSKAINTLTKKAIIGPLLKNKVIQLGAKLAVGAAEELAQEIAQEAVTFYGENLAIELQNATKGTELEGNKDFLARAKTLVTDFLPGVLLMGGIPIAVSAAKMGEKKIAAKPKLLSIEQAKTVEAIIPETLITKAAEGKIYYHVVQDKWDRGDLEPLRYRMGGQEEAIEEFEKKWPEAEGLAIHHVGAVHLYESLSQAQQHLKDYGGEIVVVVPDEYLEIKKDPQEFDHPVVYGRIPASLVYRLRDIAKAAIPEVPAEKKAPPIEKPKPEVRKGPPEIAKILSEVTAEIRAPVEEKPMIIETETYTPQEVAAARKEARQTTIEELAQEITGTGKRAISKAITAGEKIGIEEQKALQRGTALRKKIREETREHANKLAKIIKKAQDPAVGIDYEYAEGMRALASEIDPKFRTERTLQRRQALLDFVKRNPEAAAKIPKGILDMAQKKSLNELTTEDLERTVMAINKLQKLGRKKRVLQLRAEKKVRQAELSTLTVEAMEGKEPIEIEGKGIATLKKEGRHHLLHGANVWFLRPQRIIDRIGGGKGTFQTENSKSLWNRAQRITNEQITGKDERYKVGVNKMKELGINPGWLSKTHTISETTYTNGELLGLYAGMQNELHKIAIVLGNNITEDKINKFIEKLSSEGKAWADWILDEYDANWKRLQEASISFTNTAPPRETKYSSLRYIDAIYTTIKEELAKEELARKALRKAYADSGFMIPRLENIPKEFRRQVNLDLTGLWFDQVEKQENYVRNTKDIRMLQYIVNNRKWSDAVRQKLGPKYVKVTREWVNRVVDPDYYKTYDAANKISSALRRNFALAKLVFNAGTVLKQAPSWALALADIGPRLITVSLRAPFQAGMMLERMHRLSPQMRHRAVIRELEELKVMDKNLYQKIQKEVSRYGMLPIYAMDKATVTLVWNGQFEKSIAQGLSETEAAMEADNVVQRTQPAAAPKDQAQIFASSEFYNWLNMFGNQLNQIWNMISYDIPQRFVGGIKKGDAKQITQAMIGVMGIMMSGASIWMISKRRLPRDEEDLKEMLTEQFITAIPLAGRLIVQAKQGYEEGGIPAVEEISKLASAIYKKADWKKKLGRALEAMATLGGFPEIAVKRVIKAVRTGRPIELIGGRPRD